MRGREDGRVPVTTLVYENDADMRSGGIFVLLQFIAGRRVGPSEFTPIVTTRLSTLLRCSRYHSRIFLRQRRPTV